LMVCSKPLHLDGEVDVAGRVDDVDAVVLPEAGGGGGGDGDAALALLLHPVHGGLTLVDFADLVGFTGTVKNALGGSSFTSVDVGDNADVAGVFERVFASHGG
jgi:hypothetical protein